MPHDTAYQVHRKAGMLHLLGPAGTVVPKV